MANEKKMVTENIRRFLLKEYMQKETARAGFGGLDIQRTPMGTRVTLITERPGIVIGRRGAEIKRLTNAVETLFAFDNPQIEVQEVKNAYLNAQIMAEKLANALERGWHFRRAGHSTVRNIMRARAKGVQVILSGKLTGQRHRMEKFKAGHIKFCGEPKIQWMDEGFAIAKVKLGVIGVKVQVMNPKAKLPDEISVIPLKKKETAEPVDYKDDEEAKPTAVVPDDKKAVKKAAVKKAASKAKNLKKKGVDIDVDDIDDKEIDIVKAIPPKGDADAKKEEAAAKKKAPAKKEAEPKADAPKKDKPEAKKAAPKKEAEPKASKKEAPKKEDAPVKKEDKPKAAPKKEAEPKASKKEAPKKEEAKEAKE